MYSIEYSKGALEEYQNSYLWYKERSESASEKFVFEFLKSIDSIKKNPYQFKNTFSVFYEAIVPKFPYSIVFKIYEGKQIIFVTSVFHHSRNPKQKFRQNK